MRLFIESNESYAEARTGIDDEITKCCNTSIHIIRRSDRYRSQFNRCLGNCNCRSSERHHLAIVDRHHVNLDNKMDNEEERERERERDGFSTAHQETITGFYTISSMPPLIPPSSVWITWTSPVMVRWWLMVSNERCRVRKDFWIKKI